MILKDLYKKYWEEVFVIASSNKISKALDNMFYTLEEATEYHNRMGANKKVL